MTRMLKVFLVGALLLTLLATALAAMVIYGLAGTVFDPITLQIDDLTWHTGNLPEHWLGATVALLVALLVVLVIVPVAVVFGLMTALLSVGGVLLAVLLVLVLVLATVLSPLWLLVALAWWLLRKPARAGAATINT